MRSLLLLISSICYITFGECSKGSEGSNIPSKPNIVFILADDLGYNDVPWNNPDVLAPNLQKLKEKSTLIHNYYTDRLCNPSRAALMTGYYQDHNRIVGLNTVTTGGLPADMQLMPGYFMGLGYSTHLIGKWHLGYCNKKYLPTNRGFDTFYGFYNGAEYYYSHMTATMHGKSIYDFVDNEEIDLSANGTCSSVLFADRAEKIIREHNAGNPLFLFVSMQNIHGPLETPPGGAKQFELTTNEPVRKIGLSMIYGLDEAVGQIMDALEDEGLIDNTVIVFTSDNGAVPCLGGSNLPLRGGKHTMWEGGIRVPATVHWPKSLTGLEKAQRDQYDGIFFVTDWLPTLFGAAGGSAKEVQHLDGVNHFGVMTPSEDEEDNEFPRDEVFFHSTVGKGILRKGDYKLVYGFHVNGYTMKPEDVHHVCPYNTQTAKTLEKEKNPAGTVVVYNIKNDPGEQHPLDDKALSDSLMERYNNLKELKQKMREDSQFRLIKHSESEFLIDKSFVLTGWC